MLLQAVPSVYKAGLRPFGAHVVGHNGGAGLAVAVRTPESKSKLQASLQAVQGLTLLPDDATALSDVLTKIEQQYGLVLSPSGTNVTKDGRFSVRLSASDLLMINSVGVPASAPAPNAVLQDAIRLFKAHKNWHSADSVDGKTITLTTTHQEEVLKNLPVFSNKHKEILGLQEKPQDPVLQACCTSLAEAILKGDERSARILMESFFTAEPATKATLYAAINNGIMTDAMARKRPSFDALNNAFYKAVPSQPTIAEILGGKVLENVQAGTFKNFCAIRISHALNEIGHYIPYVDGQTSSSGHKRPNGQQIWHIYRVKYLLKYIPAQWGPADIVVENHKTSLQDSSSYTIIDYSKFLNKKGVMVFEAKWEDATGHVNIWNGTMRNNIDMSQAKYHRYFKEAHKVSLWLLN